MCFYSVNPSIINYCHVITSSSSRSPSAQLQGYNKQRILKRFISIHKLKWNNNRLSGFLHGKVWGWGRREWEDARKKQQCKEVLLVNIST